jgi:hypothetical protein
MQESPLLLSFLRDAGISFIAVIPADAGIYKSS